MVDLEVVSAIGFAIIVAVLLYLDRKNLEFNHGIILKRWKKGKEVIDSIVKSHPKLFSIIGTISIVIGVFAGISLFIFLLVSSFRLEQVLAPVLPSIGGYSLPAPVFSIPFWFWLIAIFIVVTVHEPMHAIFARLEKIPVRTYGIILFLILPIGAFVDPDMNLVKRLKPIKKLKIFAAGSFGNFAAAALFLIILILSDAIFANFVESIGLKFDTIPNMPAEQAGISGIIYEINNQAVRTRVDLANILGNVNPGDNLEITTSTGTYTLTTTENPDAPGRPFIGITNIEGVFKYKIISSSLVPDWQIGSYLTWLRLLFWVFTINLGVGAANMLPIKPLDGGLLFEEIFKKFFGSKTSSHLIKITTIITVGLLLFNIFGISIVKTFI